MKDGAHPLLPAAPGPPHRPLSSAPGAWGDLSSSCGLDLDSGEGTGTALSHARPLPERVPASVRLVPGCPHARHRQKGIFGLGPFPNPSSHCPRTPLKLKKAQRCCKTTALKPCILQVWSQAQPRPVSAGVAAWSPTKVLPHLSRGAPELTLTADVIAGHRFHVGDSRGGRACGADRSSGYTTFVTM